MSRPPRGLSAEEAALWAQVAATVTPLEPRRATRAVPQPVAVEPQAAIALPPRKVRGRVPPAPPAAPPPPAARRTLDATGGLDASWERKLARASIAPDVTIDLHGHTLDTAHARLDSGLTQAAAIGARLVLLITGRPRPSDDHASRGDRRGAIRAKVLDWLATGSHSGRIAAVRAAHPRHGGSGALYIVLRRPRI